MSAILGPGRPVFPPGMRFDGSSPARVIARFKDGQPDHCTCESTQGGFGRVCHCTPNRGDRADSADARFDDMADPWFAMADRVRRGGRAEPVEPRRLDSRQQHDDMADPWFAMADRVRRGDTMGKAGSFAPDDGPFDPYDSMYVSVRRGR